MNTCLNCGYAQWQRTLANRLNPTGNGRCTWIPHWVISKAFHFIKGDPHSLGGGLINRKDPEQDCPTWKEIPPRP